jgi:hypothetical protein
VDRARQLPGAALLRDVARRPLPELPDRGLVFVPDREDEHRHVRPLLLQVAQEVEPAPIGKIDVQDDDVPPSPSNLLEDLARRGRLSGHRDVAGFFQKLLESSAGDQR